MRILLNGVLELNSAAVDLEADLSYLGSCHWGNGIQQRQQIRSDWQVTQVFISIPLLWIVRLWIFGAVIRLFGPLFIWARLFTRRVTWHCTLLFVIRFYLRTNSTKQHTTHLYCVTHIPSSLRSCRRTISLLFNRVSLCVNNIFCSVFIESFSLNRSETPSHPVLTCGLIMTPKVRVSIALLYLFIIIKHQLKHRVYLDNAI